MGRTGVDIERITQRLELRRRQISEFLKRLDVEAQELDADSVQDIADRSVLSTSKESLLQQADQRRIVLRMIEGGT
jgi:hypothetical protein